MLLVEDRVQVEVKFSKQVSTSRTLGREETEMVIYRLLLIKMLAAPIQFIDVKANFLP